MLEESVSLWASMYSWFTPSVLFVLLNLMIGTIAVTSSFATNKRRDQQQQHQQNPDPFQLDRSPSVLQRLKSINFYSYRSPEAASFRRPEEHLHYAFQEHQTIQQQHYAFQELRTPQQHCTFHEQTPPHLEDHEQTRLERSPSIFQRLKSINLYPYLSPEPISSNQHSSPVSHQKNLAADLSDHSLLAGKAKDDMGDDDLQVGAGMERDQPMEYTHSQLQTGQVERTRSDTIPASGEMPQKLSRKMRKSASIQSAFSHFEEKDMVECRRTATREKEVLVPADIDEEVDAKADDFINKFKQQLRLQKLDSIMRYKEFIGRGRGSAE